MPKLGFRDTPTNFECLIIVLWDVDLDKILN